MRLCEALAGPDHVFMDCAATGDRPRRVKQAIAAGKHIFIEKPTAPTVDEAIRPKSGGPKVERIVPGLEGGTNWFPLHQGRLKIAYAF